ncbi:acyl-CoA thioesterase [bacterium]|nr:acyl-CoA thioesterase [bacterium]
METPLKANLTVRSYELDSFGHVNNAVYLQYLEFARGEFMRQLGQSFNDFQRWNAFPYVIKINIEYKAPAFCDDELEISGKVIRWSRTSFTLAKEIRNITSGKLLTTAEVVLAFVNDRSRPCRIPQQFRDAFGIPSNEGSIE